MKSNFKKKYSYKDIAQISEILGKLYNDGIPIIKSLELIEEIPLRKDYLNSIKLIKESVKRGESLCKAFGKIPNLYPPLFLDLINIGENSGKLYKVMEGTFNYYNRLANIKNKIISALIYPTIILSSMLFLIIGFIFFILPRFSEMFQSFGKEIPGNLSVILTFRSFVVEDTLYFIVVSACWGGGIIFLLSYFLKGKSYLLLSKFKIGKELLEYYCILLLNVIVSSGVGIQKGILYCENDGGNKFIREIMVNFGEYVMQGDSINSSLKKLRIFSKYTVAMVKVGEESGGLEEKLERISNTLEEGMDKRLKKMSEMIQPISIVFIALIVLVFVVNFVMPIFDVMSGNIVR